MPDISRVDRPQATHGRLATGIPGLDKILGGGIPAHRMHLIDGEPGSGKSTFAIQFLLAGLAERERCLYVTLSETADELRASAESHGWSLDGIQIFELAAATGDDSEEAYTLFHPAEVELQQTCVPPSGGALRWSCSRKRRSGATRCGSCSQR